MLSSETSCYMCIYKINLCKENETNYKTIKHLSLTLQPRSASATCSSSKDNLYKDLGSPELLQQGRSPRSRSNPGSGGNSPQRQDAGRSNPSSPQQQSEPTGQHSPLPTCSGYNPAAGKLTYQMHHNLSVFLIVFNIVLKKCFHCTRL